MVLWTALLVLTDRATHGTYHRVSLFLKAHLFSRTSERTINMGLLSVVGMEGVEPPNTFHSLMRPTWRRKLHIKRHYRLG